MDSKPLDLARWLAFFHSRKDRCVDLPWDEEGALDPRDRARIARSIGTFQLGESSDGNHLRASAARFGARSGMAELAEITPLFIGEENLHATLLASFMKRHEIPLLRGEWSDGIFRSLRKLGGFESTIAVLLVAELIAIPYYRALAAATPSPVLRRICEEIVADEVQHVTYESARYGRAGRLRSAHSRGGCTSSSTPARSRWCTADTGRCCGPPASGRSASGARARPSSAATSGSFSAWASWRHGSRADRRRSTRSIASRSGWSAEAGSTT